MAKNNPTKGNLYANRGYLTSFFPKNFLRPYGLSSYIIDEQEMKEKLWPSNIELLKRPAMGVSMFAQTILENQRRLDKKLSPTMEQNSILRYLDTVNKVAEHCANLNQKGNGDKNFVRRDLKRLFRVLTNDRLISPADWNLVDKCMHLGASMFMVGLHMHALKTWILNPAWVAEKANKSHIQDDEFRRWAKGRRPQFTDMFDIVASSLQKGERGGRRTDPLDSANEGECSRSYQRSKRKDTDSSASDDERRRKKTKFTLSSSDDGEEDSVIPKSKSRSKDPLLSSEEDVSMHQDEYVDIVPTNTITEPATKLKGGKQKKAKKVKKIKE